MDTSDPNIKFDEGGICDYCHNFEKKILPSWSSLRDDETILKKLSKKIRDENNGKKYDCIIGLSGGLDSSYVAYIAKVKMGLRPLLFHVDAGWNTNQAVSNIEKIVDGLGLDLYTEVVNWEAMKDLQVAFLKSQIPDQDLPQDAAFFSSLYKFARFHGIKTIITGSNFSTECCREPEEWGGYLGIDSTLFKDISNRFGKSSFRNFPLIDIFTYKILYTSLLGIKVVKPLNFIEYTKENAENELERLFGWKKFQHKHHESRFTRFYEDYWLPRKFGFDKRRAHLSSLIMTNQLNRSEALNRISNPEMSEHFLKQEFDYVAKKLDLTTRELEKIFLEKNKTYKYYKNKRFIIMLCVFFLRVLGLERRLLK